MTRRLRPPAPVRVRCHPDGSPASLRRGGRERTVARVTATWVHPALWWENEGAAEDGAPVSPYGERTYYRVVVEGPQILEVFAVRGAWFLDKIVD
jgi:hypothetical protein